MQTNKITSIIYYSLFFLLGSFFSYSFFILMLNNNLKIAEKISIGFDPSNLLSIIITLLLALYITRKLDKKTTENRVEKDILIDDIKQFKYKFYKEIHDILNSKKILYIEVVAKLKTIRMRFQSINKILKKYGYDMDNNRIAKLDENIRDIKDLLTETPKTKDKKQIIVNNGELSFGTKRREDIEIALDDISSKIFELIVQINKF